MSEPSPPAQDDEPQPAAPSLPQRLVDRLQPPNREPIDDPAGLAIDVGLRFISWAFLPLILTFGLAIALSGSPALPIRVGAPRDPLAFPIPASEASASAVAPTSAALLLAIAYIPAGPDPVFEDLRESARSLSLPPSEQRREAALQELEDERLEVCRERSARDFDQCFFFGSAEAVGQRRLMEGGGSLRVAPQPQPQAQSPLPFWASGRPAIEGLAAARKATTIPTW